MKKDHAGRLIGMKIFSLVPCFLLKQSLNIHPEWPRGTVILLYSFGIRDEMSGDWVAVVSYPHFLNKSSKTRSQKDTYQSKPFDFYISYPTYLVAGCTIEYTTE